MKKYILRLIVAITSFLIGTAAIWFFGWDWVGALGPVPELDDEIVIERVFPLHDDVGAKYPGTQLSDLFVFVGEKIEVREVKPPDGKTWMDFGFDAKYRIIEPVYGGFDGRIIEFRAFDHYGYPPFAGPKHVLLFVSKFEGKLYHEKYQHYPVRQTTDGRWAACGDPYLVDEYHRKPFTPKALEFPEPVTFALRKLTKQQIEKIYPSPYYEIKNGEAVCKMGAYVDELLEIKRNGVLRARGVGQ